MVTTLAWVSRTSLLPPDPLFASHDLAALPSPSPPPPLPFLLAPARSNTQPTDSGTKTSTSLVAVSAHPLLHIIRSRRLQQQQRGRTSRQKRHENFQGPTPNIQHPTSAEFPAAAICTFPPLAALRSTHPHCIRRDKLASKFSDIALHYTLACDSLQYSYSIALADYSKVESLPHLFPANFLELKGTFCEHSYWHDGR